MQEDGKKVGVSLVGSLVTDQFVRCLSADPPSCELSLPLEVVVVT